MFLLVMKLKKKYLFKLTKFGDTLVVFFSCHGGGGNREK